MSIKRHFILISILIGTMLFGLMLISFPVQADGLPQDISTGIATVTGTPAGPYVTVLENGTEQFVNVRSGPGMFYPKIGVLLIGQKAPALGKSSGDYIYIHYDGVPGNVGWVYAPFVFVSPGNLPIIEPPPTPTPMETSTIDPTLAAQFIVTSAPTRLVTFTPASPLVIPTYTAEDNVSGPGNIPMGMIIFTLAAIGILIGLFSLAQRR